MSDREKRGLPRREMLRITAVAGLGLAFGGGVVAELVRRGGLQRVRATRVQLGTLVTVTVIHPDGRAAERLVEGAFAEVERLESILSRHRAGTPLARLNREGALRDAPPELVQVLRQGLEYAALSGGAFDPTVAPLLALYDARQRQGAGPPTDAEVAAVLPRVDHRAVRVQGADVAFERPGMALTLDGIAKGYVVDRAVATLLDGGTERVILDAGGDMATGGPASEDEPWRVAIRDPRAPDRRLDVVRLSGGAVATSGDYVQTYSDDRRHHHILDPRTGRSPEAASSVTVLAPDAAAADALATTAFVLGPAAGLALLESIEGVEGLIVDKAGAEARTRGLGRHLEPHG